MSAIEKLLDAAFAAKGKEAIAGEIRQWAERVVGAIEDPAPFSKEEQNRTQALFCLDCINAGQVRDALLAMDLVFASHPNGLSSQKCRVLNITIAEWEDAVRADHHAEMADLGFRLVGRSWIRL